MIYDQAELTEHSYRVIAACDPETLSSIGLSSRVQVVTIAGGFSSFASGKRTFVNSCIFNNEFNPILEYPLLCDFPWQKAYPEPLPRQLTPYIFQGINTFDHPSFFNQLLIVSFRILHACHSRNYSRIECKARD